MHDKIINENNPPLCKCACGEVVVKSKKDKKRWNNYKHGHNEYNKKNRLGIAKMQEYAEKRGGECLSAFYRNSRIKLKFKCNNKKHPIFLITPSNILAGHWCVPCYIDNKITTKKEVLKLPTTRGITCLDVDIYAHKDTKYRWECLEGHVWRTSYNSIKRGGCPHCSGCAKKSLLDMHIFASINDGVCLNTDSKSSHKKSIWQCKKDHIFLRTYDRMNYYNSFCPICSNEERKLGIIEAHLEAIKNNGHCLSSEYVGTHHKLIWQCPNNHFLMKDLAHAQNHFYCLECENESKMFNLQIKALQNNGHLLSCKYGKDNKSKLIFQCNKGHIFRTRPNDIIKNVWCPQCHYSKNERICKEIFEKIFDIPFLKIYLKCLKGLELDGYSHKLSLAFEYQGQQHYSPIPYFGGEKQFKTQQERDIKKRKLCATHNITLIEIPYTWDKSEQYVRDKISEKRPELLEKKFVDPQTTLTIFSEIAV